MRITVFSIVAGVVIVTGALVFAVAKDRSSGDGFVVSRDNVSIVDGTQIITITAKGGYQPRRSAAKANLPTVLRFDTQGTFDCSSAVRIPSLNISRNLPPSGTTEIALGSPKVGTLQGTCGMGMYPFEIEFS